MSKHLLRDFMPTDKGAVFSQLSASLEEIWKLDAEEQARTEIVNDLVQLGLKVRRDFPEDQELISAVSDALKTANNDLGTDIPSMEGLSDVFGKLSGLFGKKKPDASRIPDEDKSDWKERNKAITEFMKAMEKTYLSQNWLNKQKFVEGPITAKDFSATFQIDGKPVINPVDNIELHRARLGKVMKSWEGTLDKLHSQVRTIHERTVKETAGATENDIEAVYKVKKATAELNNLPDPTENFPTMEGTGMFNMVPVISKKHGEGWVTSEPKMKATATDTIDALDKEGVLKVAKLIKEIVTTDFWPEVKYLKWLDFKDGSAFVDWIYDASYGTYEDYFYRFYWQGANSAWTDGLWKMNRQYQVLSGLIKWIDRSIK